LCLIATMCLIATIESAALPAICTAARLHDCGCKAVWLHGCMAAWLQAAAFPSGTWQSTAGSDGIFTPVYPTRISYAHEHWVKKKFSHRPKKAPGRAGLDSRFSWQHPEADGPIRCGAWKPRATSLAEWPPGRDNPSLLGQACFKWYSLGVRSAHTGSAAVGATLGARLSPYKLGARCLLHGCLWAVWLG